MAPSPTLPRTAGQWLWQEYLRRQSETPGLSQRAFSRALGVSSGRLSELLSGKRNVTAALARRFSERLGFPPESYRQWLDLCRQERLRRVRTRGFSLLQSGSSTDEAYTPLPGDLFPLIAEWHHLALLSLLRTDDFRSDPRWIARRLGVAPGEVRRSLSRLERLGLVKRQNGGWVRSGTMLRSTDGIPSLALRRAHRQYLLLASRSLEEVALPLRDVTSVTMAIAPSKLPLAKKKIRAFRRSLSELLEEGPRTEVYHLTVALFPLSKTRSKR